MTTPDNKILIVDDNADMISVYRLALERMGYSVIEARDGRACLEKMELERPDLVLLDVRLPGVSGTEVCRRLKDAVQTKDVPVIAVTASMSPEIKETMAAVGADDFLPSRSTCLT